MVFALSCSNQEIKNSGNIWWTIERLHYCQIQNTPKQLFMYS